MLYEDNQGAIEISRNPRFHNRTKHIDVTFHFIRERIASNEIRVVYCPSSDILADIMTKGLTKNRFEKTQKLTERLCLLKRLHCCFFSFVYHRETHHMLIKWECYNNNNNHVCCDSLS